MQTTRDLVVAVVLVEMIQKDTELVSIYDYLQEQQILEIFSKFNLVIDRLTIGIERSITLFRSFPMRCIYWLTA